MTELRARRGATVAAFAAMTFIWGTTWAAIKIGLESIPPLGGVALRFGVAAIVLLILARLLGVPLGRTRRERALWLANGVLSFAFPYAVVYWAEQRVPTGLSAVLFATYPLLVALAAHVLLAEERLTARKVGAATVGFAGIAVIFSEDLSALAGPGVEFAALVFLLSPLSQAIASVVTKRWGGGVHPISLAAVPMLIAALLCGAASAVVESQRAWILDARAVASVAYLSLAGSALVFVIYYWTLSRVAATSVALVAFLSPIVAVLTGALLFGETLTPRLAAGSALVLAGVAWHQGRAAAGVLSANRERRRTGA